MDEYTYDVIGRLKTWSNTPVGGSKVTESYLYDAAGNLTKKGNKDYSYDVSNQITTTGFEYNDNGNLASDGTNSYQYDAENRLTQVNKVVGSTLVANYTYYHDGLRKSKIVGGVTTNYSWDASGNLVQESDGAGNILASYYYTGKDNLIGFKKNGVTYIYHTNLRGDVVSVTDENGVIQVKYSYDPWGNVKTTNGTLVQPFRYAGYYSDDETGLNYLKSRYYSPALGRFLTRDGYGNNIDHKNPQTLNLYSYCGNNPVSHVDSTGSDYYEAEYSDGSIKVTYFEYSEGDDVLDYIDGNGIEYCGDLDYIMNYYVRSDLNDDATLPGSPGAAYCLGWTTVPAYYHQYGSGNENNVKYVSPDGHREAIYNGNELVTDDLNKGSYNFENPNAYLGIPHTFADVVRFWRYGNSPNDGRNVFQRILGPVTY